MPAPPPAFQPPVPGRGVAFDPPNRFERLHVEPDPDCPQEERTHPRTQFFVDASESLLTESDSPDLGHNMGLNAYRGCEHGCAYCFARPFHEYLGFSSGLEFETRIMVKLRAPALLRCELAAPRWRPQVITMSGVTDCYQPAERQFRLTRACLEVLAEFRNPVAIITKNFLVTRDRDLLAELARHDGVIVYVSITTLDSDLAGKLEPRAARPDHRLQAIRLLAEAGVPVGVMVAPVIPGLTDHEMPAILAAAAEAGARTAGYVMLRLPHAVKDLFLRWLDDHEPAKKARILDRIRAVRGGRLYRSEWGSRMTGEGIFAEQAGELFRMAARKAGMNLDRRPLSASHFRRPGGMQLELL